MLFLLQFREKFECFPQHNNWKYMIAVCYKNYCETIAVKTEILMLWYKLKQTDTVILLRELHVCR